MSVSNLINTIWVFNSNPNFNIAEGGHIDILLNFSSNGNTYTHLIVDDDNRDLTDAYDGIGYSNETPAGGNIPPVYRGTATNPSLNNTWVSQAYRIIKITGGTDVTNSSLISWLEANATQVNVTDLTDTKWVINESPIVDEDVLYSINFISNNSSWNSFEFSTGNDPIIKYDFQTSVYNGDIDTWLNEAYRLISITGGSDVSNPDLLVWLNNNATLQPNVKTFDLSTLQLSAGTHEVKVKARATGYRDSNFSNSVSYVVSSSHTVTLTISNESNTNNKEYFRVYDGQDTTGTLLLDSGSRVATPTPNTLSCSSGYITLAICGYGGDPSTGNITTSGGISPASASIYSSGNDPDLITFEVTGDGTIAITNIDWED